MEIISAVGRIRKGYKQAQRRTAGSEEQPKVSAIGNSADGFLRQQFLPLFSLGADLPEKQTTEESFFKSLAVLHRHYNISIEKHTADNYPHNIMLAHHFASQELNRSGKDIELAIVEQDNGRVGLLGKATYNTGNTLYYIPVLPLYRLLGDKTQKQSAELLLSVFAYLYHIAGIPCYRDDYSALAYYYECIAEWFLQEWQTEDKQELTDMHQELARAFHYGDIMFRKICNPYHLNNFKQRIDAYFAKDDFEGECLKIAQKAFGLFENHPNQNIFENTSNENLDEYDGIIRAQQYISFIADTKGILYQNIERSVNDEFNECSQMEQPTITQIFDKENKTVKKGLDFEYKIFPLLDQLCTLLNQMP